MNKIKIPEGYQQVMPYLILKNAAGFFAFTQRVFGALKNHETMRDENIIRHAEVKIGNSTIMFADSTDGYEPATANLFVYVENADDTYKKALEAGATSLREPADQNYGRSCGVTDPFGNTWWITSIIQ